MNHQRPPTTTRRKRGQARELRISRLPPSTLTITPHGVGRKRQRGGQLQEVSGAISGGIALENVRVVRAK